MARRTNLRLILVLGLIGAFLIVPVMASAAPSTVVTGTVTAADTGAKLQGIQINAYYRIGNSSWGFSDVTDANGEYTIYMSPSQESSFAVYCWDPTGIHDGYGSIETTIAPGDEINYDFVMKLDAKAPVINLYNGTRMYLSQASAAQLGAAALPTDVLEWAILSDGTDDIEFEADDEQYYSGRHYGYYNGSGIKHLSYSLDGAAWVYRTALQAAYVNWYDNRALWVRDVLPPLAEGAHSIRFKATDVVGNISKIKSELVVVDKTAPTTKYDKANATTKKLKLVATDALSGVKITFLKTGATGTYKYGTAISVPSSGYKYMYYYSQDRVGHTEKAKKLKVSAPARPSTPKPSTSSISHTKTFTVAGSIYDRREAKGYIRIYKYVDGAYKYVGKKAFAEGTNGKYRVSLKLAKGTYRFRAAYGGYTNTWANPPVRSDRSARVHVW